jgi:uncharacterized protein
MRVVLPGGTGYVGRHLAARLQARGDEVTVLTRGPSGARGGVRFVTWDGARDGSWVTALEGTDAVVHLAGRRVDVRPTARNIAELTSSRVEPVAAVGRAIAGLADPPSTWVQLATLAIHGDAGEARLTEASPVPTRGPRQMVGVATAWERAVAAATGDLERTVVLRAGVAIGPGDPATAQLARLARWGLGGPIASGRQWVSWIALVDLLRVIERGLDDPSMEGIYHASAPQPVRNRELMAAVRRSVGRRVGLPAPRPAATIGALVLGADPALALTGRRGVPIRLLDTGFEFTYPDIDAALAAAHESLPRVGGPLEALHRRPTSGGWREVARGSGAGLEGR